MSDTLWLVIYILVGIALIAIVAAILSWGIAQFLDAVFPDDGRLP